MGSVSARIKSADKRSSARYTDYLRGLSDEQFEVEVRKTFGHWKRDELVSTMAEFGETEHTLDYLLRAIYGSSAVDNAQEARS